MNKLLSIGFKLFGIYFFYLSAATIIFIIDEIYDNAVFQRSTIDNIILLSPITKLLLYIITGWLLILRNEKVITKLYNKRLIKESSADKIVDLSNSEILYLFFKLGGFLFILHNCILILCSVFIFIGYTYLDVDIKENVIIRGLIDFGYPLLELTLGIIMFFFTDNLIKWIKE